MQLISEPTEFGSTTHLVESLPFVGKLSFCIYSTLAKMIVVQITILFVSCSVTDMKNVLLIQ
jgi:hypothetical protein